MNIHTHDIDQMDLGPVRVPKRTGAEAFASNGARIGHSLRDFWQWSVSDLVSNAQRGVLAEYIVAIDLGVSDGVRAEWDAFDLSTQGGVSIEVKSAAYCQSWAQKTHSEISFSIRPSRAWSAETNESSEEIKRQADVYVFCLLKHKDNTTIDPLNLDQWEFYVLSTRTLNEHNPTQESISLSPLLKLSPLRVRFGEIKEAIESLDIESEVQS